MSTDAQHALPNNYDFGLNFNYAVWGKNTYIDLVNVPWNNDYRDIVKFADRAALDAYIDGRKPSGIALDKMSYVKPNEPVNINIPFNRVYRYNYLRAKAPVQPIPGGDVARNYYYFITDVRYVAPNTTQIVVQLDVWQTFGYDVTFGNCYIERGHIGIANENQMSFYGNDYLTVPEGLDVGGEMHNVHRYSNLVINRNNFHVIALSTVDLLADAGTVDDPKLKSATGSFFGGMPSGASYFMWQNQTKFRNWLLDNTAKPWLTQGIIKIYAVPLLTDWGITSPSWPSNNEPITPTFSFGGKTTNTLANWRNSTNIINDIPARYRHLKKFLTYPYCAIEITTWTGTPIIVKPESWMNDNGTITETMAFAQPSAKYMAYPTNYNAATDADAEMFNIATQIANLPEGMAVNNGAIAYLASNRNTIAYQQQSADWSQQRALAGAQTAYDQASSAMNLANELTGIGINQDIRGTQITTDAMRTNAAISSIGSAASGVLNAQIGGIASGIQQNLHAITNIGAQDAALQNRNTGATQVNRANVGQQGFVRDTNKNLADFAAKGDYANAIAGINARVQDAKMIQPTTSGQIAGETFNFTTLNMKINVTWKLVMPNVHRMIGEFWLRYGYAINRFIKPPTSLMVMDKFTYWKMKETYITTGEMPETFKQSIRGIFEKGVTVWANPADIGNVDLATNNALTGVSY